MDVSANQIVHHLEKKVISLRKGIAEGDEVAVRECAAAIEAYCQLLKGTQHKNHTTEKKISSSFSLPSQKEDKKEDLGNIFDF